MFFTSTKASSQKQKALEARGARVFRVPSQGKLLSLKAVLNVLTDFEVRSLLVEGGGEVHASFVEEKLADEVYLFLAPKLIGGLAPSWVKGKGVSDPGLAPRLRWTKVEALDGDLCIHGLF